MDLPGVGTIGNTWDLRKTIHDYLGRFDFTGKRVLDVGSASGFLTFEMERRGASVVSFDIQAGSEWNYVPYASPAFDVKELTERLEWDIRRIKRAYWYAHRALQSRASVYYGNIYDIPAALGAFDVVNFGMVLPHLRDPFLAMQSAARLSRRWVIITQQSMQTAEPVMRFIPDAATLRRSPNLVGDLRRLHREHAQGAGVRRRLQDPRQAPLPHSPARRSLHGVCCPPGSRDVWRSFSLVGPSARPTP
jgi:SAM-dependent methyltransferase